MFRQISNKSSQELDTCTQSVVCCVLSWFVVFCRGLLCFVVVCCVLSWFVVFCHGLLCFGTDHCYPQGYFTGTGTITCDCPSASEVTLNKWLILTTFFQTADREVHVIHLSCEVAKKLFCRHTHQHLCSTFMSLTSIGSLHKKLFRPLAIRASGQFTSQTRPYLTKYLTNKLQKWLN